MKKLFFGLLISWGILALVVSCAKKDNSTSSTSTLSAPDGLTATGGGKQVSLDWTAVSGASSYTVYWDNATGVSSSSTAITSITDDNYTHSNLDGGTTYYYKVATVNSAGTGTLSSEVNATSNYLTPSSCTDNETVAGAPNDASLTVTGIKDLSISGTYSMSWYGAESPCIDNSTALSQMGISSTATDVSSLKNQIHVTSNSSFTNTIRLYSDSSCSSLIAFFQQSKKDVTAGDNISISSPPSGFPSYATKYSNKQSRSCIYGGTTPTNNLFTQWTSGSSWTLTKGELMDTAGGSDTKYAIMTSLDNKSGSSEKWLYMSARDQSSYPDNYTTSGDEASDVFFSDNPSWYSN
jgi:hypothetical protein